MSVVEKKSGKPQERKPTATTTSTTKTITKNQKIIQTKMNAIVKNTSDDKSLTTSSPSSSAPSTSATPTNVYDKIYYLAGKSASTDLGQFTIEKIDGLLSVVEKTAKWSLPENLDSKSNSEKHKDNTSTTKGKLERPCGWLPFLSLIVALRFARIGLSFGSLMIGNEPVTPETMVYFLQTRRRKLRAIKYQGLRSLRQKQRAAEESAKRIGIMQKLTSVLNLVVYRPGKSISAIIATSSSALSGTTTTTTTVTTTNVDKTSEMKTKNTITENNKNVLNLKKKPQSAQKRPLEKDDDSENDCGSGDDDDKLHCTQLLDKYGGKSSDIDEDPDYHPASKELDEEELDSSNGTEDDDEENDDVEKEISDEEREFLLNEKTIEQNTTATHAILSDHSKVKENGPTSLLIDEKFNKSSSSSTSVDNNDKKYNSNIKNNQDINKDNNQSDTLSFLSSSPPPPPPPQPQPLPIKISPSSTSTSSLSTSPSSASSSSLSSSAPSDIQNPKSTSINPVRLSPKIAQNGSSGDDEIFESFYDPVDVYDYDVQKGLRIRCRDLIRLSGGEECFYSPIGSPVINEDSINNYQQLLVPSVVIDTVPSSSSSENNISNEHTINENQLPINNNEITNEMPKSKLNNIKSQYNHQPKTQQQNKKAHYNNIKHNKGRKVH